MNLTFSLHYFLNEMSNSPCSQNEMLCCAEFSCVICRKVMSLPLTTPCAHNFCKACLENAFSGQTFIKERTRVGGRALRAQKNVMKCPSCSNDISDFLQNPQVTLTSLFPIYTAFRTGHHPEIFDLGRGLIFF